MMSWEKLLLNPQQPDTLINFAPRVDSSTQKFSFVIETPDSVKNKTSEKKTEKAPDTIKTITRETKKTEVKPDTSFTVEVPADTVSTKPDSLVLKINYDPDTIPFLLVNRDYYPFKQNFLFNLLQVKPTEAVAVPVKKIPPVTKVEKPVVVVKDTVTAHTEKKVDAGKQAMYKEKQYTIDWMVILILSALFVLVWVKIIYGKVLSNTIKSTYNYQVAYKSYREINTLSQRVYFFLNIIFIINIGLFIYLVLKFYNIQILDYSGPPMFLIIGGIILAVYLIKYAVYKILGFVLMSETHFGEYLHSIFLYNKTLGLALFPVIIGMPYVMTPLKPVLVYAGIILFGIFFISRIIRGVTISLKINLSVIYMILYLCTLEILPMFVLFKFFKSLI